MGAGLQRASAAAKATRLPKSPVVIEDTMSHRQIADTLASMIFTAAHDWCRTVKMDRNTRDMIVKVLRSVYGG